MSSHKTKSNQFSTALDVVTIHKNYTVKCPNVRLTRLETSWRS